jgi:hypothetical protein
MKVSLLGGTLRRVQEGAGAPDAEGLGGFARRDERHFGPVEVRAAIESMTGSTVLRSSSACTRS